MVIPSIQATKESHRLSPRKISKLPRTALATQHDTQNRYFRVVSAGVTATAKRPDALVLKNGTVVELVRIEGDGFWVRDADREGYVSPDALAVMAAAAVTTTQNIATPSPPRPNRPRRFSEMARCEQSLLATLLPDWPKLSGRCRTEWELVARKYPELDPEMQRWVRTQLRLWGDAGSADRDALRSRIVKAVRGAVDSAVSSGNEVDGPRRFVAIRSPSGISSVDKLAFNAGDILILKAAKDGWFWMESADKQGYVRPADVRELRTTTVRTINNNSGTMTSPKKSVLPPITSGGYDSPRESRSSRYQRLSISKQNCRNVVAIAESITHREQALEPRKVTTTTPMGSKSKLVPVSIADASVMTNTVVALQAQCGGPSTCELSFDAGDELEYLDVERDGYLWCRSAKGAMGWAHLSALDIDRKRFGIPKVFSNTEPSPISPVDVIDAVPKIGSTFDVFSPHAGDAARCTLALNPGDRPVLRVLKKSWYWMEWDGRKGYVDPRVLAPLTHENNTFVGHVPHGNEEIRSNHKDATTSEIQPTCIEVSPNVAAAAAAIADNMRAYITESAREGLSGNFDVEEDEEIISTKLSGILKEICDSNSSNKADVKLQENQVNKMPVVGNNSSPSDGNSAAPSTSPLVSTLNEDGIQPAKMTGNNAQGEDDGCDHVLESEEHDDGETVPIMMGFGIGAMARNAAIQIEAGDDECYSSGSEGETDSEASDSDDGEEEFYDLPRRTNKKVLYSSVRQMIGPKSSYRSLRRFFLDPRRLLVPVIEQEEDTKAVLEGNNHNTAILPQI